MTKPAGVFQARSQHAADSHFVPRPDYERFDDEELDETIGGRFVRVANRQSAKTALVDGLTRLSYGQLLDRATEISLSLNHQLAGSSGVVLLHMPLGREVVEVILGVLMAGRPYMCLPPSGSARLFNDLVESATPAAIVVADSLAGTVPGTDVRQYRLSELRTCRPRFGSAAPIKPTHPACLFATSGTAGVPKLVGLSHRAVMFDVGRQINDLYIGRDDRIDLLSHPSFSASLSSIFTALLSGAELHVTPVPAVGFALGAWLGASEITISTMTVSRLRTITADRSAGAQCRDLRLMSVGGEELLDRDVREFYATFPRSCVLQNALASTEVRTYAQYFVPRDDPRPGPVPVGWPVCGKEVFLVDATGEAVSPGAEGEIAVRSHFLADGYVNDSRLSMERFSPQADGSVVFRTGDRGRFREDGCLLFDGRADSQVKIRGYRVEPRAVEHALVSHPSIRAAAVVSRSSGTGETYLAAFVAPARQAQLVERDVRTSLLERLPPWAVPSVICVQDDLPLSRNGKVDYECLKQAQLPAAVPRIDSRPEEWLGVLCLSWAHALGRDSVMPDDDFFSLGGNSLSAVRLQVELYQRCGVDLPFAMLLRHPTPGALAGWLHSLAREQTSDQTLVLLRAGGSEPPLFCVPGIGGEPTSFGALAARLSHERRVYGFGATVEAEPPGCAVSIPGLARAYIAAMGTVVDWTRPVHLCGHSFGSLVALEMVHQLEALGRPVGVLAVIDTPLGRGRSGPVGRALDFSANLPGWLWYDLLRSDWENLTARTIGKTAEVYGRFRALFSSTESQVYPDLRAYFGKREIPPDVRARVHSRLEASRRYSPEPIKGSVLLFRSRAQALFGRSDRCLGWDALASSVDVHDVPGHHESCIRAPHVDRLATALAARLRSVDTRSCA